MRRNRQRLLLVTSLKRGSKDEPLDPSDPPRECRSLCRSATAGSRLSITPPLTRGAEGSAGASCRLKNYMTPRGTTNCRRSYERCFALSVRVPPWSWRRTAERARPLSAVGAPSSDWSTRIEPDGIVPQQLALPLTVHVPLHHERDRLGKVALAMRIIRRIHQYVIADQINDCVR